MSGDCSSYCKIGNIHWAKHSVSITQTKVFRESTFTMPWLAVLTIYYYLTLASLQRKRRAYSYVGGSTYRSIDGGNGWTRLTRRLTIAKYHGKTFTALLKTAKPREFNPANLSTFTIAMQLASCLLYTLAMQLYSQLSTQPTSYSMFKLQVASQLLLTYIIPFR